MDRKPLAIHARWNKDLTITLYADRKKVFRTSRPNSAISPKESVQDFLEGWFGDHPHQVRWTYA